MDLAVHFVEYGIWGVLLGRTRWPVARWLPLALLFAAFDEAHQVWIPGRVASWSDLAADAAGLFLSPLNKAAGVFHRGHG